MLTLASTTTLQPSKFPNTNVSTTKFPNYHTTTPQLASPRVKHPPIRHTVTNTPHLPSGRGPEILPGTSGNRWMVSDPANIDGGSIYIAIVKDEIEGLVIARRHVHVLVPPVLCTDRMRYCREVYVTTLLQRCKVFHRWQLESILPAKP